MFDPLAFKRGLQTLKNADPQAYSQMLGQFQLHVTDVTVAVTAASPSDILVAQGRAQEAIKLFQILNEIK